MFENGETPLIRKRTLIPLLLLSSTTAFASPNPPPPDDQVPKELLALRSKLAKAGKQKALKSPTTYRALCDEHGYPLVGNMLRKGNVYQPSEFCEQVRKDESKA